MTETVLEEAQRIVYGDREESYGHPFDDFTRTGKMWAAILGVDVTPEQVALCMVALKISRECHRPGRDNRVDGPGYFATLDRVVERRAALERGAAFGATDINVTLPRQQFTGFVGDASHTILDTPSGSMTIAPPIRGRLFVHDGAVKGSPEPAVAPV